MIRLCHAFSCLKNKQYQRVLNICKAIQFDDILIPNAVSDCEHFWRETLSFPVLLPFQQLFDDDVVSLAGLMQLINPLIFCTNTNFTADMSDLENMKNSSISFQFLRYYLILRCKLNQMDKTLFGDIRELETIRNQNNFYFEIVLLIFLRRKVFLKFNVKTRIHMT